MPENAPITFLPSTLPEGVCYANDQQRLNGFAAALHGFLPGSYGTFIVGNSVPAPENQNLPWIRLDASGYLDRVYYFTNGLWLSPHYLPPGSMGMFWVGSLADLATFDGGEVGTPTLTSGPFWTEAVNFRGRIPIGVGTLPLSGTAITVGQNGGVDQVTLTSAQLPPHTHDVGLTHGESYTGPPNSPTGIVGNGANNPEEKIVTGAAKAKSDAATAVDNMPPYRGVYFVGRTIRRFYRAS